MRLGGCLRLLVLGAIAASSARADVTDGDLQVAARALSFMERPLSGRIRVGIVYSPDSGPSQRQASEIDDRLGAGLRVGSLELQPVLVPIDAADDADVDLFLLTEHMASSGKRLSQITKRRQAPCVTTDVEAVRSGHCVLAVQTRPKVEIIVNRESADASGIAFATAFRVMVTEI